MPLAVAVRTFAGLPGQVARARRWLKVLLRDFSAADDALLVLTELAANAVLHSNSGLPRGLFTVRVTITPGIVRLEVADQGGPWRAHPVRQDGDPNCGRGLTIIAALASSWGLAGGQAGRTAWCEISGGPPDSVSSAAVSPAR